MKKYFVDTPRDKDRETWQSLFADYFHFYKEPVPPDIAMETTWQRLLSPSENPYGLFMRSKETESIVGFIHYLMHCTTDSQLERCYMQDAFIAPEYRRQGLFRLLYQELRRIGLEKNWQKIYWITQPNNHVAQKSYERLGIGEAWIRYEDKLQKQ